MPVLQINIDPTPAEQGARRAKSAFESVAASAAKTADATTKAALAAKEIAAAMQRQEQVMKAAAAASSQVGTAFSQVATRLKSIDSAVQSLRSLAILHTSFQLLRSSMGGVGQAVIGMNASLEKAQIQFTNLLGSSDAAREHVASLFQFAASTPFETGPIIQASRTLLTFGGTALATSDTLRLVGDAAAGTSTGIEEVAFWFGRAANAIQSGRPFGEASARLQELGILSGDTRTKMEALQKAGGSTSEAYALLTKDFERFKGQMEAQAGTWEGLTSTITDNVNLVLAEAFHPFFKALKDILGASAALSQDSSFRDFAQGVASAAAKSLDILQGLLTVLKGVGYALTFLNQGRDAADTFALNIDTLNTQIETFQIKVGNAQKAQEKFNAEVQSFASVADLLKAGTIRAVPTEQLAELRRIYDEGNKAGVQFDTTSQSIFKSLGIIATAAAPAATGVGKFGNESDEAAKKAKKLAESQAEAARELTAKAAVYQQVIAGTLSLADAEEELKIQQLAAQTGSRALAESYVKLETNAKSTAEAENQLTEAVARQVEKMQGIDKAILDAQQGFDDSIGSINAQKAAFDKVIAAGGNYETAMKEAEVAAARFNATQQALTSGAGSEAARLLADQAEEATRAAQGWDTYTDSVRAAGEAGVNITEIIKEGIRGLAAGTLNLKDFLKRQGQALGVSLVEGILFGKASKEKSILVNFNELLGVDAAGIFGKEGLNLGGDLIGGILQSVGGGAKTLLQSVGIDVGSLFGQSAVDAGAITWESGWNGIFNGTGAGSVLGGAQQAGISFGSLFGGFAAGAAGVSFGKSFSGLFGLGKSDESRIGANVGGTIGSVLGFAIGGPAGSALGGFFGSLGGSIWGSFFEHTPTRGTQIRKGLVDFFDEIEATFADELSSKKYFFEETKALAKAMFGGDFLAASKQILTDKAGPELAKQLQALGTFLTADQALALGKSVEQAGTTPGNLLVANLGIDRIPDAIQETIAKADIGLEDIVTKLNTLFEDSNISEDFYRDAILGAVDIFDNDLPKAINTSAIALKSFTDDGIFSLSEFEKRVTEATGSFDAIGQAFVDAVRNSNSGEEAAQIFGEGLERGLADLALNRFLQDFIDNKLFEGIDLSDGISAEEKTTLKQRAAEARQEADALVETIKEVDAEAASATESVNHFADALDRINAPFANLGQNLGGTINSFFDKRNALTSKEAFDRALDANVAAAREGNAGTPGNRTPNALKQLQRDLANIGTVGESIGEQIGQDIGESFKQAMIDTLINEAIIGPILEPFQAKMKSATEEALSDGILTADEQANLANLAAQASAAGQAAAKGLTPAIEGINNASENIAKGTETAADNFKDIVFPKETKDVLTDFGGLLESASKALGSVTLTGEASNAKDIAKALTDTVDHLKDAHLPPSLPVDVKDIETALTTAATALSSAGMPDALTDVNSIVKAISDAIRKLNDAHLTIDVALKNTGVQQFAGGGIVQGPSGRDKVPAMLTAGERVLSLQETATYEKLMEALTGLQVAHFANGGVAGFNNLALQTARDISNETGARASKREVGKRIWEGLSEGISAFLDTGEGTETLDSKIAGVRSEFENLSKTLEQQRKYLTKAGIDVDSYLSQLSAGVTEKIRKLLEEANQVVVDAAAGIRNDITSLLLGGDSPLSATQKLSAAQAQESLLRAQLGAATTPEERANLAQQISQSIQQQIGLSPFDRFGQDFQEFFQSSLIRLQDLSSYLTGNVQGAPQGVQVVGDTPSQEVKIEIVLPPGSTDSDESVRRVKRELLPEMEAVVYKAMGSARGRGIINQTAGPR